MSLWIKAVVFFRVIWAVTAYDGREFERRCAALAAYIDTHTTKDDTP